MKMKVPVEFKGEIILDCPDHLNEYNKLLLAKTYLESILLDLVIKEENNCSKEFMDQADYSEFPLKIPFIKKSYKNPTAKDWEELKAEISSGKWIIGQVEK